jgi:ribosome-associated toxin RatA of RatAB toxin-antitoxin module
MKRITRSAIVEHSADQMFALVDDIGSYPRFLPWCKAAVVEERTPEGVRATLTVGMRGLNQAFTTQNINRAGESIELRLVKGPFRRFGGSWRFAPLSGEACRIEFSIEYEMAGALSRLLEPAFDHIADSMVDAFTRRAAELYGRA